MYYKDLIATFDTSRQVADTIERLILAIEQWVTDGECYVTSTGVVIFDPGAVKAHTAYYLTTEHLRRHNAVKDLQKALGRLYAR